MLIAVCTSKDAGLVVIDQQKPGFTASWKRVLTMTGSQSFESGDIISTAEAPAGMTLSTVRSVSMNSGVSMDVAISKDDQPDETYVHAVFSIGSDGLSSTGWLHPDGKTTVEACESVPQQGS